MTIHCACGDNKCHQAINISGGRENVLRVWDSEGRETMLYIDANFLVTLVHEAGDALIKMMSYKGEQS